MRAGLRIAPYVFVRLVELSSAEWAEFNLEEASCFVSNMEVLSLRFGGGCSNGLEHCYVPENNSPRLLCWRWGLCCRETLKGHEAGFASK